LIRAAASTQTFGASLLARRGERNMTERTITKKEFKDLCDFVFTHRESIWQDRDRQKPGLDDRIALLQYLEQQVWDKVINEPRFLPGDIFKTPAETFYHGIQTKIDKHGDPPFDSRPVVDDMLNKAVAEKKSA
jgi:hypothetical protein